eukprot:TRINITY_DN14509_c0_g1_i4.p1 TRINITY_DN14509_c0_g1~~TRINITY_DN14509_c0_g1_i4.p1  ORF type:complete len:341 (-),score=76.08 TRINITY_DN14509_c0_g1_i4:86-1069(-)
MTDPMSPPMSPAHSMRTKSERPATQSFSMYWVPHETAVWLPGKIIKENVDGKNTYESEEGVLTLPANKNYETILDSSALEGVDDICTLNNIDDASVIHSLRVRYRRDDIYTYISCMLVAVNPFKPVNIYSGEYINVYRQAQDIQALPPHVFGISAEAFLRLSGHNKNQAVLVSGESGAGKTETTKYVLLYMSEVLKSDAGLAENLLRINPLLEAFGNAKTVRNDNSSRFGKWIEVNVDASLMSIAGASVTDYLLEVTRVVSQGPGDRNYHIFYQLCTEEAAKVCPGMKLTKASDYEYLKKNPSELKGVNDTACFRHMGGLSDNDRTI